MSISIDVLENQRRAVARERAWRHAQNVLLIGAALGVVLAIGCALVAAFHYRIFP